ncbi:heparinase II/III family protein [bacterium AH-315-E10]|nr:heparinase II/III family protein [bacterium AH-315-E10]
MRPQLLITENNVPGLRSLAELKDAIRLEPFLSLHNQALQRAISYLNTPALTPSSMCAERRARHAEIKNCDYIIVNEAGQRIQRAALMCLLTDDIRFKDDALVQLRSILSEDEWPDWRDQAHPNYPVDLRTGQFMHAVGQAYDWLHNVLSDNEREFIIDGMDRRAIQPYLESLKLNPWWATSGEPNNWMTCIVGGASVLGMGFRDDHPKSQWLMDYGVDKFKSYLDVIGKEGEFNECVGYSGAMRFPIEFLNLYRYVTLGKEDLLDDPRIRAFCDWYMYVIVPPGVNVPFGDTWPGAGPVASMFAGMAGATRNPIYQWFYETYADHNKLKAPSIDLLLYDPSVKGESPTGKMPLARAFKEHSACWSSRTSWDPYSTQSVVMGKGGHGNEGHGHHDAGTLCIDAYGKALITDPGNIQYPSDYFGANKYQYYNAAAHGHNVPVFDGMEMKIGAEHKAEILHTEFNDVIGSVWSVDTTALYSGVSSVRRAVIHLFPNIIAVLDLATLADHDTTSIRWHTIEQAEQDNDGGFSVWNDGVCLQGKMINGNDSTSIEFFSRTHVYEEPFDYDRNGSPLEQKNEPFLEAIVTGTDLCVLTVFATFGNDEDPVEWSSCDGIFKNDKCCVYLNGRILTAENDEGHSLSVSL